MLQLSTGVKWKRTDYKGGNRNSRNYFSHRGLVWRKGLLSTALSPAEGSTTPWVSQVISNHFVRKTSAKEWQEPHFSEYWGDKSTLFSVVTWSLMDKSVAICFLEFLKDDDKTKCKQIPGWRTASTAPPCPLSSLCIWPHLGLTLCRFNLLLVITQIPLTKLCHVFIVTSYRLHLLLVPFYMCPEEMALRRLPKKHVHHQSQIPCCKTVTF